MDDKFPEKNLRSTFGAKKKLKQFLLQNGWFLFPFLLFQAVGLYIIPFEDPVELFLAFHSVNNPFMDALFKFLTHVAEWYGWVAITAVALLIRVRWAFFASFALTISGLITHFLKRVVFSEEMRPSHFLAPEQMNLIEGVELHSRFSFPSGHTTGAFAIFLILTILLSKKWKPLGLLAFIAALAVGYSRIHLGQHFHKDVLAGSALGVIVPLLVYWPMNAFFNRKAYLWAEKSLVGLFTPLG